MLYHNKDDIELVTEFPCLSGHSGPYMPVFSLNGQIGELCQFFNKSDHVHFQILLVQGINLRQRFDKYFSICLIF